MEVVVTEDPAMEVVVTEDPTMEVVVTEGPTVTTELPSLVPGESL